MKGGCLSADTRRGLLRLERVAHEDRVAPGGHGENGRVADRAVRADRAHLEVVAHEDALKADVA